MKYNVGDVILWLFPIDRPEVSTIVQTWRDFDGTLYYNTQTYRKEEGRILEENFTEKELDGILNCDEQTPMAWHYPVIQ